MVSFQKLSCFFFSFINKFRISFFLKCTQPTALGLQYLGFQIFSPYSSQTPKHLLLNFDFILSFLIPVLSTWRVLDNNNPIYLKHKIFIVNAVQGTYHNDYFPHINFIIWTKTRFLTFSIEF